MTKTRKIRPEEIKKIGDDIYVRWTGKKSFVKVNDPKIAAYLIYRMVHAD